MAHKGPRVKRVPFEDLKTFEGRAKHLYVIQTKDGENKPFEFWEGQQQFNEIVNEEFKRTKQELGVSSCRIIALKPRQVGWTTYSNIRSLDLQIQDHGSNGVIAAHDNDTTEKVYWIYQRAYDHLPKTIIPTIEGRDMTVAEFIIKTRGEDTFYEALRDPQNPLTEEKAQQTQRIPYKPDTQSYSGKRIGFEDTDSVTTIFTAGKGDAGGLGGTVRRVHLTECANFPRYKELMTSLKPSIPKKADNVFFIMESTANGTTGEGEGFYKAWTRNVEQWEKYQRGDIQRFTGMRPVFIPWYMFDEYELSLAGGKFEDISTVDFGSPEAKDEFLEREERLMDEGIYNPLTKEKQVLTPEKINWYRFIIKEDCESDFREAQRFYPTTPEEAFVASSNCYFNATRLNELKKQYLNGEAPDATTGELEFGEDALPIFKPSPTGNLKVWVQPEEHWENRYVVGCLPEGESVLTDKGTKEVQNVSLNDKLINREGEKVSIRNRQVREFSDEVYEIDVYNHFRKTRFTGEHPLYLSQDPTLERNYNSDHELYDWGERYWNHEFDFLEVKNAKDGDWIKYPNTYRKDVLTEDEILKKWTKLNDSVRYDFHIDPPVLDKEFWWFIGMWLGDGWLQKQERSHSVNLCFNVEHDDLKERANYIDILFDRSIQKRDRKYNTTEYKIVSKQLYKFIKQNFGEGSSGKYISEWVKYLPEKYKKALVEGYLNADGSVFEENRKRGEDRARICFVSVSLNLLEGIQDILFSLGVLPSLGKLRDAKKEEIRGKTVDQKKTYQLGCGYYDSVILLDLLGVEHNYTYKNKRTIKSSYFSKDLNYIYFKIKDIKKRNYSGKVYNFECDTHTYLSRGIVTHNCDIARGYEHGDYSVATVFDRLEQDFVAEWFGMIDQDKFADILVTLGIYYNEALLVPEANMDTVVELIKPDGHNHYVGDIFYRSEGTRTKWGFWTSGGNRNVLLSKYKAWLRDSEVGYTSLKDEDAVDEHLTFVRKQTNTGVKYEHSEGNHDDRVLSRAFAVFGDHWWEQPFDKYEPSKVMEVLGRKSQRKRYKQSKLGRR